MLKIKELNNDETEIWDSYVLSHPHADYSHLYNWKLVFSDSYSLETMYLGLFDSYKLVGILPSVIIKYPFNRNFAFSLPYLNYAGILSEQRFIQKDIIENVSEVYKSKNIQSVELRSLDVQNTKTFGNCTLKLQLPNNPEDLWKSFKPKVRNQIRKAEKYCFSTQWGVHQLDKFYNIYRINMHELGTPVHSKKFFKNIIKYFPNETNILTVYKDKLAISSMFVMSFKNRIADPWASSLKNYLEHCPNMLMYWEALKYGIYNGYSEFDFGRSQYFSGTYNFKTQWGAKPYNLCYNVVNILSKNFSSSETIYRDKKASLFVKVWKLMPRFMVNVLGPHLRRFIP
ncbi:MAG: peptidoglycan bridge formation glycyltransferase FemA/FemB family protein [Actinobacteria bacterium]|nr:peptidoglycan bridge formation glycyltransferase FemA/FemB family protein [Actinomycetota bacterium]